MAVESFTVQMRNWSEKAKRNATLVVAEGMQDVFGEMSRVQPSVKETGGRFELGKIPVDTGTLRNSLFATLNGTKTGEGQTAYTAALAGFEIGDTVTFAFSAKYAPFVEYGFRIASDEDTDYQGDVDVPGRFMVREAINGAGGWQARLDAIAKKYK